MKTLVIFMCLMVFCVNSYAYEKWEQVHSTKDITLYVDESSIYKNNDTEYIVRLRGEYKKPKNITVTQRYIKNGKQNTKKIKSKYSSESYLFLMDVNKGKMYLQSGFFITSVGNVDMTISPSDVIDSLNPAYSNIYTIIKKKFYKYQQVTDGENVTLRGTLLIETRENYDAKNIDFMAVKLEQPIMIKHDDGESEADIVQLYFDKDKEHLFSQYEGKQVNVLGKLLYISFGPNTLPVSTKLNVINISQ